MHLVLDACSTVMGSAVKLSGLREREREGERELCDRPAMPAMAQKKRRGHRGYMIPSLI